MADKNENDASELDGISDNEAEQLLADEAAADDRPGEKEPDADRQSGKDWEAEAKKWRDLSRKNEKSFKDAATKLQKYEDSNKSESQRLQEERDSHRTRAEKAEFALKRREVAEELAPDHATAAQIRAVAKRLSGDTDEALEADAKELFELLAPESKAPKTTARPKEKLRGGSEPDEDPEPTDPRKLAAMIPRRR